MNKNSIQQQLSNTRLLIDQEIDLLLPNTQDKLAMAMRYSTLSAGKRLRPFILLTTSDMWNIDRKHSLRAAATIEIIHSYSLIHDDLPAMDDDDYRRDILSCHRKFDEATAILAGDSLLTLAFEILANPMTHPDASIRCDLIRILSENIGLQGMAGGQMQDLLLENGIKVEYSELVKMQMMKTGKLFIACCEMGARLGNASQEEIIHLNKFAEYFGLAFQFIDDLEDIKQKKPLSNNNIVKLIGADETAKMAQNYIKNARKELAFFGSKAKILDQLACSLLD